MALPGSSTAGTSWHLQTGHWPGASILSPGAEDGRCKMGDGRWAMCDGRCALQGRVAVAISSYLTPSRDSGRDSIQRRISICSWPLPAQGQARKTWLGTCNLQDAHMCAPLHLPIPSTALRVLRAVLCLGSADAPFLPPPSTVAVSRRLCACLH